jgi:peptidyl-tRNA hydrolase
MQKEELIRQLTQTLGKTKIVKLSRMLEEQNFALHDLIDATFYPNQTIAFRAAWLLENLLLKHPHTYLPELDYLLSRIKAVNYPGCQRHYAKVLMHLTAPGVTQPVKEKMKAADLEPVVEKCFEWLIDPNVKIAVKCFSATVLFQLKDRFDWMEEELIKQLEFLMRNGSAAIQARGRKLKEMCMLSSKTQQ